MNAFAEKLHSAMQRSIWRKKFLNPLRTLAVVLGVAGTGAGAYWLHFNLSAIASIYLLLVVLISLQWGFAHATVASVASVLCMNYLFIPPIFELRIADPENWISLATFEAAALLVSKFSSRVVQHAVNAESQRDRTAILYELSRAILLIDGRTSTSRQLALLIHEVVHVAAVEFWVGYESGQPALPEKGSRNSAQEAFAAGTDSEDLESRTTHRLLKIGTTPIGAMILRGWQHDSLLADAVASLSAIAFERARAIQKENRAEAERNTEQLRTVVLDSLAHGFKTPLTAIQTASSGLLAIDGLTSTQAELVSIIDEQATMLSQMTTRLLQTAALESREIRMRRTRISLLPFLENVIAAQDEGLRSRLRISAPDGLISIDLDARLTEMALLQLIDNAAKYSPVGRNIEVALRQNERETTVVVANTGTPIQVEERERIFERFYRRLGAAHGPAGTGLGLSIVKKTAEAHGGRAWVECEGDTTRFYFTIENYRGVANG